MFPLASHRVVIANLQLYHAIYQKRCKLTPKLLQNANAKLFAVYRMVSYPAETLNDR